MIFQECDGVTRYALRRPYTDLRIANNSEKVCGTSGITYENAKFLQYESCFYEYEEIDCLGECPCNSRDCLENLEITLKNVAKTKYPHFEGTYTLASDKVNSRPYWILTDQNATMWYNNNNWIINDQSKIGTLEGLLMNTVGKAPCPTMGNWTVLDLDTGEWISTSDDVEVKKIIGNNVHITAGQKI